MNLEQEAEFLLEGIKLADKLKEMHPQSQSVYKRLFEENVSYRVIWPIEVKGVPPHLCNITTFVNEHIRNELKMVAYYIVSESTNYNFGQMKPEFFKQNIAMIKVMKDNLNNVSERINYVNKFIDENRN
ncbi:MAG: hypothetical protein ABIB43_06020 [archaeon]